jgi:hypothetical protein
MVQPNNTTDRRNARFYRRREFVTLPGMREETRSLWEQLDSSVELWRRGRVVLVLIALFVCALQGTILAGQFLVGNVELLPPFIAGFALFWLQFYLIWIGVQWIRWLAAVWSGLTGFVFLIWAMRDGNGYLVIAGCTNLIIGSYLGLSPSVYFFAKRQREQRSWLHSLMVAAAFVLLFVSFSLAGVAWQGFKAELARDADDFAREAFIHIFTEHDTAFFLDHLTERAVKENGGRTQLTKFLQYTATQAGDVHDLEPTKSAFWLTYHFPSDFSFFGTVTTQGIGNRGMILLRLDLIQRPEGWRIEALQWRYRDYGLLRRR